jgi:beta-glucuronidase
MLLNGEPVQILGVNRHEDHPEWGFALPQRLMLRDLDLANDLGANAIRGAHYPNDQRMLDLCDERGILFMEEIPLWGFSREQMARDVIGDRASAMLWAMIDRDVNHPCIWAWSVLSECATHTPEGRMMVERLVETAREADPTRPVTFSSGSNLEDICFDLVDIVCVNAGHGSDRPDLALPELLDRIRAKIGDRPLIVSEFGAGAIPGRGTLEGDAPWSEEHQRRVLTGCIAHLLSRDDLLGFYIWQLFDTRSDAAVAGQCPRGYDKHGLLDEYRRPKLAYHAVRDLLAQANSARSRPRALPATG